MNLRRVTLLCLAAAVLVAPLRERAARAQASDTARRLSASPPPLERSSIPKLDEWKSAEEVRLERPLPETCRAHLVREWLRVRCAAVLGGGEGIVTGVPASGVVLSGRRDEVAFYMLATDDFEKPVDPFIEVVMALRPGNRRLVQLTEGNGGYYGFGQGQRQTLLISERWLPGDSAPLVTVSPSPKTGPLRGMRLGTVAEAKELDLPTKWGGPIIVALEPQSGAERGGAKLGDKVLDGAERLHRSFEDADGATFDLIVQRNGYAKLVKLPLGP